MNGTPQVSAIIANWNGAHHLRICIPSLLAQSYEPLEIIVVDNDSSDDSRDVASEFPVKWLALEKNMGLAPALNRGAASATGEILLFLNNDMRFDRGFVGSLVAALEQNSNIFATDGMQFNWDGTLRGHLATRLSKGKPKANSSVQLVPGLYFYQQDQTAPSPVFMGSAACLLVRRLCFEKLGGFDERLPLGYEDVEICWRAWLHGWGIVFVPGAVCWHHVGGSAGSREGARVPFRGILTGRLLFATKLLPVRYTIRTWAVSIAGLLRDLPWSRLDFANDRIEVLFQVAAWVPQLLRERRALFSAAGKSPEQHLNFLLGLTEHSVAAGKALTRNETC